LLIPWARWAAAGVAALALVAAPLYLSPGDEYIAGLAVIAILLALSYNLLLGSTGMVSFGHAAFYGVGAFTVALLTTRLHGDALLGLALAPLIGAAFGLVAGAFALRAVHLYFSLLTLAVSQLLYVAAFEADTITGGDNGIHGIPIPDFLNDPTRVYYFVLGIVAIGAAVLFVITRSPFGAALTAIRENRQRAAFIGLRVRAYELAAFTIASSLAAVAGALYAVYDQQAFPGLMFWTESGIPVLMVLIGGSGIFLGPALGAVFYTFLAAKVQSSTIYWDLIIGSVLLFVVLVLPGGLASLPERARALVARVRTPRARELEVEPIMAMSPHADAPPQAGEGDFRKREREIDKREGGKLAGSNGHLLVVRGLSKHFMGLRAVDGVDLDVKTGRVHAVIGPNGAGKSTLFNLVSGRMRPDSGKVVFDGADVTGAPPNQLAHVGMGRGFQTTAVFPRLTVEENLRLALMGIHGDTRRPFGNARKLYRDEVDQTITSVGLEGRAATPARELSHGHQRALELGISLALGARLLLLDEPTAGMSPYETRRTLELLQQVIEDRDVTLLITEHDMEVVFGIADTVTVMAEGHVLTEGSPDHVRNHPDVIRVYLGTEL
jgi:ABC-type branched-subunit amino acid transport system ATPase component/ABC-type branched-subunit amino acid transport system permease subunit